MANFIPLEWDNGVISSVLWTSTDITTVKKNEIEARKALTDAYHAADRANRAKTEFLSNMSHDIRTPMNAIIAMTANAFAEDVQLAKNAGMNEHIAKPLDFDKLNETMAKWLGHDEK